MQHKILFVLLSLNFFSFDGCEQKALSDDNSAFEYREIYLPEGIGNEARELGLNSVDNDWGIWGHNLSVVLPENPAHSVYATVNGQTNTEQFCFSSDRLYQYIERYILDLVGERRTTRFSIIPQDNYISCLCEQCVAKGCTYNDASPAVFSMIERLATRFPHHLFFTSYYLTTRSLPSRPLPSNAGVLYSAIHYYLAPVPTTREQETEKRLEQWGQMTSHLYVWDYIDNFDDYLTPYPLFSIMQRRLQLYRRTGVAGVFLNGSGPDYSTFSRIRTHVLAALLRDPDCDWRPLLEETCRRLYPEAGATIARFMLQQEDLVTSGGRMLPIYQGADVILKTYVDAASFCTFHDELLQLLPTTQGEERQELTTLCQALAFTRLEIKRIQADTEGCEPLLQQLAQLPLKGIRCYNESYWTLESYIQEYRSMLHAARESQKKNRLLRKQLVPLTALDEEYTDISILTDGLAGIPSNYHCGHLISSADPALKLAIPQVGLLRHLRVGLTYNAKHHIGLPSKVTLSVRGREIAAVEPKVVSGLPQRVVVDFDIPSDIEGTLVLTLVRNPEEKTMALDEVEGW